MTREEVSVQYSAFTHDHHSIVNSKRDNALMDQLTDNNKPSNQADNNQIDSLSTITILHRHPMYDSLVLVKRYRTCLKGYSLEFPTSDVPNGPTGMCCREKNCCKSKLVSLYLDGDDPIYQSSQENRKQMEANEKNNGQLASNEEIVHVPMNGLLDRLNNYDRHGISVDGRVYAFAMGLKTAEKFLSTSSVKELQETPPL